MKKVETYNPGKESFADYEERLRFIFVAGDLHDGSVPDGDPNVDSKKAALEEKRKATLLGNCGSECFSTLRNLMAPKKLSDCSYNDIVQAAVTYFQPSKNVIRCRFDFANRKRKSGESFQEFLNDLKKMAADCKFKDTDLMERLRDQIVFGLNEQELVTKLIAEGEDLTYDKCVQKVECYFSAVRDGVALKTKDEKIFALGKSERKTPSEKGNLRDKLSCYRCGLKGHFRNKCKVKVYCKNCESDSHATLCCRKRKVINACDNGNAEFLNLVDSKVCGVDKPVKPYFLTVKVEVHQSRS